MTTPHQTKHPTSKPVFFLTSILDIHWGGAGRGLVDQNIGTLVGKVSAETMADKTGVGSGTSIGTSTSMSSTGKPSASLLSKVLQHCNSNRIGFAVPPLPNSELRQAFMVILAKLINRRSGEAFYMLISFSDLNKFPYCAPMATKLVP